MQSQLTHVRELPVATRLQRARVALAQAEQAAGLSQGELRQVELRGALALVQEESVGPSIVPGEAWEVPRALHSFFPEGITHGQFIDISGARALLLSVIGHISRQGAWVAFVGMPDIGWDAATKYGLELDAMVSVPNPGPHSASVISALMDGFDVVVLGDLALSPHDQRTINHRARTRGVVALTEGWSGARIKLRASDYETYGYRDGVGHLTSWSAVVYREGLGRPGERLAWSESDITRAKTPPARLRVVS